MGKKERKKEKTENKQKARAFLSIFTRKMKKFLHLERMKL